MLLVVVNVIPMTHVVPHHNASLKMKKEENLKKIQYMYSQFESVPSLASP